MDLSSCFESLWTGLTHPNKFRGRPCTLLLFQDKRLGALNKVAISLLAQTLQAVVLTFKELMWSLILIFQVPRYNLVVLILVGNQFE